MMRNPQEVFENHLKAVATLNPEGVMEDYSPDAIFVTPDQTYTGAEEIKKFYEELLPKMKGFEIKQIKQETHGNVVYLVWYGKNDSLDVQFCTDTYLVEKGKIKYHTFAGIIK